MGLVTYSLKNLFKKPATVIDPHREIPVPDRYRGVLVLDREKCVLCGLCAKVCPANCIAVDRKEGTYIYNPVKCIGCRRCEDVCNKKAVKIVNRIRDPTYEIELIKF
jgi:NADH-quinone oxidoreductase subunit I